MIGSGILTEHHLTPVGWAAGNPPADRVETWTRRVFEDLRYGREEVHWHCEWASPDVARAERNALRNRHSHLMWEAARFPRLTVSIGVPL